MPDKVSTSSTLKFNADFVDGDTRIFSIKNPRSDLTANDVIAFQDSYCDILVGDKDSAGFRRFGNVSIINEQKTYLDLTDTTGISTVGWFDS